MMFSSYSLLQAIRRHWNQPVHPVYKQALHARPPWDTARVRSAGGVLLRLAFGVGLIALASIVVRVLTDSALGWSASALLVQTLCLSVGGAALLAMMALTFLWPVAVAVLASSAIVEEREKRTWEALLTTPLPWPDILTAKLASTLRWLSRPTELLLWVQGICLLFTVIIVLAQSSKVTTSAWIMVLLCVAAGVQFTVARAQDYTTASLIGLGVSLVSESRQTASTLALILSLIIFIARVLITAVFINLAGLNPTPPPQGLIILLATGPTSIIALALAEQPLLAFALLAALPLLREAMIRRAYRWVIGNLGHAAGNS